MTSFSAIGAAAFSHFAGLPWAIALLASGQSSTFTGTIVDITRHSDSTIGFSIETPERAKLAYLPGQYVNVHVPGTDDTRSYSFSSAPDDEH